MPDIMAAFPSTYLKAADLGKSRPTVTIDRVSLEEVGDDHKPVVYFAGKDKGLVLNKTNAGAIVDIAGTSDYSKWGGVAIRLFATKTEYAGKRVDCIRIDEPEGAKPPAREFGDDTADIGF